MPRVGQNEDMIAHTIGAILAGGSSRRMGRDKSRLIIGGTPFLERVHDTMAGVFTEVIVCGGSDVPADGVLIPDERPGEGPVGGLLSAMRIGRGRPVFVTTVDMPLVTFEAVCAVVEPGVSGRMIRIASVAGEDQPLFGVYGPDVEPVARAAFESGRRSILAVIDDVGQVTRIDLDPDTLFNVNTEADYERLIERHGL